MNFGRIWIVAFIVIMISVSALDGCRTKRKKLKKLEDFDAVAWESDKNGCQGKRIKLKDQLLVHKYYMRGLNTTDIEHYLGKPDAQELFNRSQKYYIYFLEPGPRCENPVEKPLALFVRFSAVGIANEFTIRTM